MSARDETPRDEAAEAAVLIGRNPFAPVQKASIGDLVFRSFMSMNSAGETLASAALRTLAEELHLLAVVIEESSDPPREMLARALLLAESRAEAAAELSDRMMQAAAANAAPESGTRAAGGDTK